MKKQNKIEPNVNFLLDNKTESDIENRFMLKPDARYKDIKNQRYHFILKKK